MYNSKIVDRKTGYSWFTTISDTSAASTTLWFDNLRKYLERQHPHYTIKFVRRDGGVEHGKEFT
jgi:hypothetical protein